MQITKDTKIAGVPAVALRKAFKDVGGDEWSVAYLAGLLKVSDATARKYVKRLLDEGYVEPANPWRGVRHYQLSQLGSQVAEASAAKPIGRNTADRLIAELCERADEINGDQQAVYKVLSLAVFGSYLSDAQKLGDVNVVVELSKGPIQLGFFRLAQEHDGTFKRLRGRSRALSLHPSTDDVARSAACKVIYRAGSA